MRYGFVVPNNFGVADPHDVVGLGVRAEELGFDSVWVNHHVINAGYVRERLGDKPYHDALVTLTWLASMTSRVRIGTSVLVLPYLHPMVLARELATLDHLAGGRLDLGVGVGSLPDENAALGSPYDSRGAYSNEFLEVLLLLWTEESASYEGQFFAFGDVVSSPKPLQRPHPPILVGGNRKVALRRAARYGDGWHPMLLKPDSIRSRLPTIRTEAARLGRLGVPSQVSVRLEMSKLTPELVNEYEAVGVTELVLSVSSGDVAAIRSTMDRFASSFVA